MNTVKVWNTRFLIIGITLAILAIVNYCFNLNTQTFLMSSALGFVVCLFGCLLVKQVKDDIKIVGVPVIRETINGCVIKYEIPGLVVSEVSYALSELNKWKEKNNFDWSKNKNSELIVTFSNPSKSKVSIVEYVIEDKIDILEYSGLFTYYMNDKKRFCKINDIQLGNLNLGIVPNIDDIVNKECHLWIKNNQIIGLDIIGG